MTWDKDDIINGMTKKIEELEAEDKKKIEVVKMLEEERDNLEASLKLLKSKVTRPSAVDSTVQLSEAELKQPFPLRCKTLTKNDWELIKNALESDGDMYRVAKEPKNLKKIEELLKRVEGWIK